MIRQQFDTPPLDVFMITAYGDSDSYNQALSLGAIDLLTKPLNFRLLREKLHLENSTV